MYCGKDHNLNSNDYKLLSHDQFFCSLTRYVLSVASVSKLKCEQQDDENSYSCCGDYVIKHLNFDSLIVDFLAQNTALDGRECCIDLKSTLFLSNGITSSPGGGTPANFG